MKKTQNKGANYAFIDSQNLHLSVQKLGWNLDFRKFKSYLKQRFNVEKAFMFIGYMEQYQELYDALEKAGYTLIYKEVTETKSGEVKGNCDADLVLHTMKELPNYNKAVIVSGDGDFTSLVQFLNQHDKLERVIVPDKQHFSFLLDAAAPKRITSLNRLKKRLAYRTSKRKRKGVQAKAKLKTQLAD